MPDYLKKAKLSSLMNKTNQFSTKGLEIEKAKEAPVEADHQGATAAFAVKETFDAINAIRAKLESAERRQSVGYGKGAKVQTKKNVKEFADQEPVQEDADESEEQDVVFRKPISGKSSRGKKGKESVDTVGSRRVRASERSNLNKTVDYKTPSQNYDAMDSDREDEYLLDEMEGLDQTPSILGSGKTRMGSTDEQGNRFSNMPGEERPSLTSVTPYDDDPEEMAAKVEKLVEESRKEKEKIQRRVSKARGLQEEKVFDNLCDKIKDGQDELLKSKRVIENGGK